MFKVGDIVKKTKGYNYPGVIVSVFDTTAGDTRYVVEATGEDYKGMLHIFNGDQLEVTERRVHRFNINGEDFETIKHELSFDDIVRLSHPGIEDKNITNVWTATYFNSGYTGNLSGSIHKGETVVVYDDMCFTCLITSGN